MASREHDPEPVARRVAVGGAGGSSRDTPWPRTASRIIDLQRSVGNRAVRRLLARPGEGGVLQRSIFDTLAEAIEEVVHTVADPIGAAERLMGIGTSKRSPIPSR
jgi:hypothetical protein